MGKFNKAQQRQMKHAYLKTQSLILAGKIMGCSAATVRRYRDLGGWIGPIKLANPKPDTSGSTLTTGIAMALAGMWRLHMENKDACHILNLSQGSLDWWLRNDTEVTMERTIETKGPDGKTLDMRKVKETIGLHQLREREWSNFQYTNMQKIELAAAALEEKGGYAAAAKIRFRLLEKRLPALFADHMQHINVQVNTAASGMPESETKEIQNILRERYSTGDKSDGSGHEKENS